MLLWARHRLIVQTVALAMGVFVAQVPALAQSHDVAAPSGRHFESGDAQSFVETHIRDAMASGEGTYAMEDARHAKTLALEYDGVDFVRTLTGYGFFPSVNFHEKGDPEKKYIIDFWVKSNGDALELVDRRILKAPKKDGDKWVLFSRLPKPWWWIPASEHPGESENKRNWEIMAAINEFVAQERKKNGGAFILTDDKTGEKIAMDFIEIHQPVRRLKSDGRFFACTDFRRAGTSDEFYDIDFWLDEKDGKISVGDARVHKAPVKEDGGWVQIPRYSFESQSFDLVP